MSKMRLVLGTKFAKFWTQNLNNQVLKEIPIKFQNRIRGKSNLDSTDIRNFISSVIELRKFKKNK